MHSRAAVLVRAAPRRRCSLTTSVPATYCAGAGTQQWRSRAVLAHRRYFGGGNPAATTTGGASRPSPQQVRLCELLGVDVPLIQAPMAGAQGSALAAAVSEAGALGSLPTAMLDAAGLRAELAALDVVRGRGAGSGRRRRAPSFNVNFFVHTPPSRDPEREEAWAARLHALHPDAEVRRGAPPPPPKTPARSPFDAEAAAALADFRPRVVSFHFGLPSPELLAAVRGTGGCSARGGNKGGVVVMSTATTIAEARWLRDRGVDVIIAQGTEAGGHRGTFLPAPVAGLHNRRRSYSYHAHSDDNADADVGAAATAVAQDADLASTQMGTFALLPQVVAAVAPTPVVAAGGIADAAGVEAAFALGAAGVQVGTAFLLCDEATITAVHRRALLGGDAARAAASSSSSSSAAAATQAGGASGGGTGGGEGEPLDPTFTAITNIFTGRPSRGIVNAAMRRLGCVRSDVPDFPLATAALAPLRAHAEAQGSGDWSPLWAGQNVSGCREGPAAEVVRRLAAGVPRRR